MALKKRQDYKKLGELLVEKNLVTQEQLMKALEDQKKNGGLIGEILVGWGHTSEEAIVQAISSQYGFPSISPTLFQPNEEVIRLIPKEVSSRYSFVGLDKFGSVLTVAMSNPLHVDALNEIEKLSNCEVMPFITTYTEIMRCIQRFYQIQKPGSI